MKRIHQRIPLTLLCEYRGWAIERNSHGTIIASKSDLSFPMIVTSVETAKIAIDARESN
jgi:hypothetical protein